MADTTVTAKFRADTTDLQTKLAALQRQMEQTQTKFAAAGATMQSVGKKLTLGVTTPIVGLGIAATKSAMDFETSMSKIEGLVGVASDEVASMGDQIMETSAQFGVGANEAAEALFFITSAGLRGADAMDVLEASMKASQIGLGDVSTVADLATSALNAYGPSVLSATEATDVLTAAVREGKLEASELSGAMGQVLPVASAMGVRFDEVGAAMAAMSRTGTNAATASTQLRGILNSLLKPSQQAEKALAGMGLSSEGLRKQIREQGLLATLQTLSERFAGNDAAAAQVFGNVRALAGVLDLMGANADTTAMIFDSLTDSVGATDKAFAVTAETAGFKMNQAMAEMKNALVGIGDVILPVASQALEFVAGLLQRFNALNPSIKTAAVIFGAVAAALGPVLWIGGKVVTTVGTMATAWLGLKGRVLTAATSIATRVKTLEIEIKTAMIKSRTQLGALGAAAGVVGKKVIASFRTIGIAAKGLIASFGPIGIALTALTIGFEIFMNQSADTQEKVEGLKGTLDETTGAFTDLTAAMIAQNLAEGFDPELLAMYDELGLGVDDLTAALIEGGDAVDEIGQRFNDNIGPISRFYSTIGDPAAIVEFERRFGGAAKQVDQLRGEMESQSYAQAQAESAIAATGVQASATADDFGDLEGAVADTETQMKMLTDMFGIFDKNVAMIRARDEASAYMNEISENLAKTSRSLEGEGKAALKNRDVVLGAFEAKQKELATWAAATGATAEEVSARWFEMTQDVRRQLIDEGFDSQDLAKFLGSEGIDVASVQVSRDLERAVGTMADRLGPYALRAFKGVGTDIGSGLAAGIASKYTTVEGETRTMINRAEAAARSAAESRSPSKVFERVGADLMNGIKIGIEGNQGFIRPLGKRLVENLAETIESGKPRIFKAAKSAFVDWYREVRDELKTNLDDAVQLYDEFADDIQQSLMRGIDFAGAFEGQFDDAGKATGISLLEGFRNQVKQVEWAGNVYQAIRAQALEGGASQVATDALLQALAAEGPGIGGALGQQILDEGLAATMANEYQSVIDATRAVGEALMPEHLLIGRNNAQAEYTAWVERMGPGGDLRKQFLADWRQVGVETSQSDYEGMRDALKKGGPVGDAIMNLFNRLGGRSAESTASKFSADMAGGEGNRMRSAMDALAASLNRTATVTIITRHVSVYESQGLPGRAMGGPVAARQAYVVGERGPEVFVPGMNGNIIPNNMMSSIPIVGSGGGGGGGTTNININVNAGMGTNGAEVGREIVDALRQYERRNGPLPVKVAS